MTFPLSFFFVLSPHGPVETVGTEAMSTLGLKRSSQYVVTAVAQVFVLQLIAQDLLGEAGFIALHGRRRGRFLRGHGVCSHVTPVKKKDATVKNMCVTSLMSSSNGSSLYEKKAHTLCLHFCIHGCLWLTCGTNLPLSLSLSADPTQLRC